METGSSIARSRAAATLIVVRRGSSGFEVLMGCRGRGARFMPGSFVFPGGSLQRSDFQVWPGEAVEPRQGATPILRALARAAIRETFEETGLLIGRPCGESLSSHLPREATDLVSTFAAAALTPAVDALRLVGRAITPTSSPIRFHARFFLADGRHATGHPRGGHELEDVGFYPVHGGLPSPISDVTQFMLRRALDVCEGTARDATPLYCYVGNTPRVRWFWGADERPAESTEAHIRTRAIV